MPRTLLTVSLLLLPGWSLAAKPPNEAKIKALKAEIDKLRHEEGGASSSSMRSSRPPL